MAIASKQLGQARPADANAVSIYSPGAGVSTRIGSIAICNNTGSVAKFRIFLDDDGTDYDESTALYYDFSLAGNTTLMLNDLALFMNNSAGNLAVRTDTADALTFTVFGIELS